MTGARATLHAHLYSHLDVMEASVAQTLLAAAADAPSPKAATLDLVPISPWSALDGRCVPHKSVRLPGGGRALPVFVALGHNEDLHSPHVLANLARLGQALRADSPGAPSNHREAVEAGRIWLDAEAKELGNHARNASWTSIPRSEVIARSRATAASTSSFGCTSSSATGQPRRVYACRATPWTPCSRASTSTKLGPQRFAIPPRARSSPTPRERGAECAAWIWSQLTCRAASLTARSSTATYQPDTPS